MIQCCKNLEGFTVTPLLVLVFVGLVFNFLTRNRFQLCLIIGH